jgi:cbb3-type cytochrome oxidase maturation protein
MTIIYVLIPIGLVLLALGIWAFFWASGSGQYDDLDSPAWKILMDDDSAPPRPNRAPAKQARPPDEDGDAPG